MPEYRENQRGAKILIVEDNTEARENLSLLLEIEGFTVVTAQNGLEALEQLKPDSGISVIVLDLWMPVMNGWEFLRQKADIKNVATIPVIVVSALPMSAPPEGSQAFLPKPVSPERLFDQIERCVT